ncbi:MAG: hypothetical protein IIT99_07960, partial [Bacteroidales bacterium]|nr:hypothetical protein [Bacteroidales bacterium]
PQGVRDIEAAFGDVLQAGKVTGEARLAELDDEDIAVAGIEADATQTAYDKATADHLVLTSDVELGEPLAKKKKN